MAVIFVESFDDRVMSFRWNVAFEAAAFARTGSRCIEYGDNAGIFMRLDLPAATRPVSFAHGAAVRVRFPGPANYGLYDFGDRNLNTHLRVNHRYVTEQLEITGPTGAVLLSSAPGSFRKDIYHYVEVVATIDNVAGAVSLFIDGANQGSVAGIDTQSNAGGSFAEFGAWYSTQQGFGISAPDDCRIDDVYITDTAGPAPYNGRLGDVAVIPGRPNGNGTYSEQTGSDGNQIDNYLLVDEFTPDGDSTYVESATVGHRELYPMQDLGAPYNTWQPWGLSVYNISRHLGVASGIRGKMRTAGVDFDGADQALAASYAVQTQRWDQNPNTVADWTPAEIDAVELGQEVRP